MSKYSPNSIAPFSLLVPVFGILSAALLLNETLKLIEIAASLIVFTGLIFIVFGSRILNYINRFNANP